jgi:hypothetical protein
MVQPKYSPEEALQRVKLMMNYDLSKTSTENKKVIKEQVQNNSIFSCIKNHYTSKNIPYEEYSMDGYEAFDVNLGPKLVWSFSNASSQGQQWLELKKGDNIKKRGTWKCNGNSNFVITKADGTTYNSALPTQQAQDYQAANKPVQTTTKPVQTTTKPVQSTPDPSKPTDVRRGKERLLKQPLKDDSVNILNCRKQIDDLFDAWTSRNSSTAQVKAGVPATRDIVQACYDQHQGKFALGRDANRKLTILSGRDTNEAGPLENGKTAIYRIKGK